MSLIERFVVGVDIQGFSSRVARRQVMLERDLDRMLDEAAEEARVSRALWERSVAGDGEVAVLPAEVDMLAVVRKFVSELDHRLTDHNEDHHPETRIRLRVAMHIDVITPAALGYAGPALIVLQRLLDSAPLRTALTDAPDASLAQIISECLYQKTVVPELGGLRPRQFQKVQVDLPAKGFQQTAYVYVPGGLPAPATDRPRKPVRPPVERSGFPLPVPARTATRRERHLADIPSATAVESPHPAAEPRPLSLAVQELVRELWQALEKRDIYHADLLTTLALLEMAGRRRNGWLRDSHGRDLPGELFTEVDEAWAAFSEGAWGFGAQRGRLSGLVLTGRKEFRRLALALGWLRVEDEPAPPYAEFAVRENLDLPFFPTLRNPPRERFPEWRDEWSATVMSVHVRLQRWEK